jgi:hypothetical protein
MPVDFVRVNNTRYSWNSTRSLIDGAPTKGIVAVDYSQKRERKTVYAQQQDGRSMGFTAGKYSVDSFTLKFLKEWSQSFTDMLTGLGAGCYGDAEWTYIIQCVEPVLGAVPIQVVAGPCVITGKKDSYEEGVDELVDEFEILCLQLTENGKQLWSAVRSLGI